MKEQIHNQPSPDLVSQCPICFSVEVRSVIDLTGLPILANVLWEDRATALTAPRGDVALVFCPTCGHVYNQSYASDQMEYDVQYENSLHFSPRFQTFATWLAHYLVDKYSLRGKTIVEIGSGKGDFLRLLCEYGGNVGTGFDPSYKPNPNEQHNLMSFIKDTYSEKYADYQADLICSRHTLEHIYQPSEFVQTLRRTIGDRKQTILYAEVPNFEYMLRDTAIWDVIYEHYSYFTPHSLSSLFSRNGFNVLHLDDAFSGQFLYIEAIPRDPEKPAPNGGYGQPMEVLAAQVAMFSELSRAKIQGWRRKLDELHAGGKRVVIWGAGSKGISFLNMLNVRDEIEYVIDINPRKRNKFITGSGQQIVPPDFLTEYRPDTIIVMNPIYMDEISKTAEGLGISPEFLTAS
jgi:SAM-dependent methyltransferase